MPDVIFNSAVLVAQGTIARKCDINCHVENFFHLK